MLAQLDEIEPSATAGPLRGGIVLTAPELFGRLKVLPVLERFMRQQPLVSARVLLVNRVVDLLGESVDIAVRLATLPDSTMTAIRFGEIRSLICASPAYLARACRPAGPQDLAGHDCIRLNAGGDGELCRLHQATRRAGAHARSG